MESENLVDAMKRWLKNHKQNVLARSTTLEAEEAAVLMQFAVDVAEGNVGTVEEEDEVQVVDFGDEDQAKANQDPEDTDDTEVDGSVDASVDADDADEADVVDTASENSEAPTEEDKKD